MERVDVALEKLEEAVSGFAGQKDGSGEHIIFELALGGEGAFEAFSRCSGYPLFPVD